MRRFFVIVSLTFSGDLLLNSAFLTVKAKYDKQFLVEQFCSYYPSFTSRKYFQFVTKPLLYAVYVKKCFNSFLFGHIFESPKCGDYDFILHCHKK